MDQRLEDIRKQIDHLTEKLSLTRTTVNTEIQEEKWDKINRKIKKIETRLRTIL